MKLHNYKSIVRAFAALAIATIPCAAPAQSLWNGAGANTNWSLSAAWSPAVVPSAGSNVLFTNLGTATVVGSINNVVDSGFAGPIANLQYANTNAGTSYTTQIASNQTLTVTGSLTVGTQPAGGTADAGAAQTVTTTITGAGGKLAMTGGASAILFVNQASASAGAHIATLIMTNLDTFTANIGRLEVGVASGINRAEGALHLAKTNIIMLTGAAPELYAGFNNGNNNGNNNLPLIFLGLSNQFNVDSITIGADKQQSFMGFDPVFTNSNPVARFRGTNGDSSAVGNWILGNNSGQTTTSSTSLGTNDFSNGTLDALVNQMIVGESERGAGVTSGSGSGFFTFSAGTLTVNNLFLGFRTCTAGNSAGNGTMNVNGTATLVVNNALCLSYTNGGNAVYGTGALNINGGTVLANTITNGVIGAGNPATITMNGGLLGVTSILGTVGTLAAPINGLSIANSTLELQISGVQTNIETTSLNAGGSTNRINVTYLPPINIFPVTYPIIGSQNGLGVLNIGLGTLPPASPAYAGYITNDANTVYLVLTTGPTIGSLLDVWSGSNNSNWDTATPNWKYLGTTATFANGSPVQFDDSATGTTSVSLIGTLLPASITVSNNTLPYTFGGAGRLSGGAGLTKSGSGTLLITNTGANDFIGGVTINAGTVQFGAGGTNGTLPAADAVTDNGTLIFNRSDTLSLGNALSGAGALVQAGTNVLTIAGSNSFSGAALVNSGTLLLNGQLSGSLSNAAGSTIGGSGTNTGVVTVTGRLQPSAITGVPTTLTAGALTVNSGGVAVFDLIGTDTTAGNGSNDLISVAGDLDVNNGSVSVNFLGVPQINTPYTLINFGGTQNGTFNGTILGTHFAGTLSQGASPVTLTLTGAGANLKWASTNSALWDTGTTANFLNGASPSVFYAGDNVFFDDTPGVVTNVTIPSGNTEFANLVTINSTNNNFNIGGGVIGGQASVQKFGPSQLSLNSGNTFSGPVQIFGGVVRMGANGATGTGTTFVSSNATLDIGGRALSGSVAIAGFGVGGNGAIVNNTFVLNGDQNAIGNGVTLYLQGDAAVGCANRWDIRNGNLSSYDGNPYNLTILGTNEFTLVNATVDASLGNVDVKGGLFAIQTSTLTDSGGWAGDASHSISVESNATLEINVTGIASLGRGVVLNDGGTLLSEGASDFISGHVTLNGSATINVTAPTLEIDGMIAGPGGFTKVGSGPMTLTGSNAYTGSTIINAGKVTLVGSGSLSTTTNITVGAGALLDVSLLGDPTLSLAVGQTLAGNGAVNGNVTVNAGATVAPGVSPSTIGTLTVSNTATLSGTTLIKINRGAATNDVLAASTINFGGVLSVVNTSASPFQVNDSFRLFNATSYNGNIVSITPATPGAGLVWDTNNLANGVLAVAQGSTPPQPVITHVTVNGNNLVFSGTNGVAGESYTLLTSPNITLPLNQWTPVTTNSFTGSAFNVTNTIGNGNGFFVIRIP